MSTTDGRNRRKVASDAARQRLAEKRVAPMHRAPRGNQELDRELMQHSIGRLERVMGH
jgi:hypothetical protein